MYGGGDKGVDVTDYLTGGDVLFFLDERLTPGTYMLTEEDRQLFRYSDALNRNIFGEVFVLRRMDAAGKSWFGPVFDSSILLLTYRRCYPLSLNGTAFELTAQLQN
jgi:hypothetical protein